MRLLTRMMLLSGLVVCPCLLYAFAGAPRNQVVPSATPSPIAAPQDPSAPISFLPPLSLTECLGLIERARLMVPGDPKTPAKDVPVESLDRMLGTSYNYLRFRDDLHTSAAHFDWAEVASSDIEHGEGGSDSDVYDFDPPLRRVSAVSLDVSRADVWIHRVRVYDEKGEIRDEFPEYPVLLMHSLPRRQVFHLWRRTTVSRIEVECVQANPPTANSRIPRVGVYAGITYRPELVKTAMYHIEEARGFLAKSEWKYATAALEEAEKLIEEHIRRFRPEVR